MKKYYESITIDKEELVEYWYSFSLKKIEPKKETIETVKEQIPIMLQSMKTGVHEKVYMFDHSKQYRPWLSDDEKKEWY